MPVVECVCGSHGRIGGYCLEKGAERRVGVREYPTRWGGITVLTTPE